MSELQFDPDLIATLACLESSRVEFVLVGDVANAIYDHGGVVSGVAIVPASYGRNSERLANALHTLRAELGIAGRPDPRGLDWRQMDLREVAPCSFVTVHADIDVDFQPAGCNGYPDLFQDAARIELGPGARPHVASSEDLDRLAHRSAPAPPPASPEALPPPAARPAEPDWLQDEIRASFARARL
jgi:hypothetical protein